MRRRCHCLILLRLRMLLPASCFDDAADYYADITPYVIMIRDAATIRYAAATLPLPHADTPLRRQAIRFR